MGGTATMKLLALAAAFGGTVGGGIMTYSLIDEWSCSHESPHEQLLRDFVPADAAVVISVTDYESIAEKFAEAMTWLEPAVDAMGGFIMGQTFPIFAETLFKASSQGMGFDFGEMLREAGREGGEEMLRMLRDAGIDTTRRQLLIGWLKHGGPGNDSPFVWAHVLPIVPGRFSYQDYLSVFDPAASVSGDSCFVRRVDRWAVVTFDPNTDASYGQWLDSRVGSSLGDRLTPEELASLDELDLAIHVRAIGQLASMAVQAVAEDGSASPEAVQLAHQLAARAASEYRSLTMGGSFTRDGIHAALHIGLVPGSELHKTVARTTPSMAMIDALPSRTVAAAQVNNPTAFAELLDRELPDDETSDAIRQLIRNLPEHAAIALVGPPSPEEMMLEAAGSAFAASQAEPSDPFGGLDPGDPFGALGLAMGVMWLVRPDAEGYDACVLKTGEMVASLLRLDPDAPPVPMRVVKGAAKSEGISLDRIVFFDEFGTPPDGGPPVALSGLSIAAAQVEIGGSEYAVFVWGTGEMSLIRKTVKADRGSWPGLRHSPAFRPVRLHMHGEPILLAVGPMKKKSPDLADAIGQLLGAPKPDADEEEGYYYTSMLMVSRYGQDLRLDAFVSALLCKDVIGSATGFGFDVLGLMF